MQSEGVAADIAVRWAFVQRVEHSVKYWSWSCADVEDRDFRSIGAQPVVGMGKIRASVPLVDKFEEGT